MKRDFYGGIIMLKFKKKVFMLLFMMAMVAIPMSVKAADYDVDGTEEEESYAPETYGLNGKVYTEDDLDDVDWDLAKLIGEDKIPTSDSVKPTTDISISSMYNEYKRTNRYVAIGAGVKNADCDGVLIKCYDSKKKLMWSDFVNSGNWIRSTECWNKCCYFEFYNCKIITCPEGAATDYKFVFAKPVKKWYVPEALTFTGDHGVTWNEKKMVATSKWNPVKGATKYEVYVRPYNKKENAKWYKVGTTKKNSIKISKYRNDKLIKGVDYEVKIITCCGKYKCKIYDKFYINSAV